MELTPVQIRILGCLVEKQTTTPDNYPLTTNALVAACNQTSDRDPVVGYDERTVDAAMLELRTQGLARTVTGGRANKHRHVLDEAWQLSASELAVLAVLFLRGPQTTGELRQRCERMHPFDDLHQVESVLEALAARAEPFVVQLQRVPGQKERRWAHLLGEEPAGVAVVPEAVEPRAVAERRAQPDSDLAADLAAEVARLRVDVDRLYELLGESPPEAG